MNAAQTTAGPPSTWSSYSSYVIGIVMVGFTVNLVDRQILTLLLQSLKKEFSISDTSLGLLSGLAFTLFYSVLCIPISRIADRTSRTGILSISMALWSAATAACGLAQSLAQLVACRLAVGLGEAGFTPVAAALVSDYAPPARRATAIGAAMLGIPLGMIAGLLVAGWGLQNFGWRGAFLLAGLPGIAVALLFRLTVKEPVRAEVALPAMSGQSAPWRQSLLALWHCRTYRYILAANTCSAIVVYGLSAWMPAFVMRSFAMRPLDVAYLLAPALGIAAAVGYMAGGILSDKLSPKSPSRTLWLCAGASVLAIPMVAEAAAAHRPFAVVIPYALAYLLGLIYAAPTVAMICSVVAVEIRAFSIGILISAMTLIGQSLGPLIIGILSDAFGADTTALGRALAFIALFYIPAAWLYVVAARHANSDVAGKPSAEYRPTHHDVAAVADRA